MDGLEGKHQTIVISHLKMETKFNESVDWLKQRAFRRKRASLGLNSIFSSKFCRINFLDALRKGRLIILRCGTNYAKRELFPFGVSHIETSYLCMEE